MPSTPLANLARIGQLDQVPPSKELGLRMLEAARGRLKDASFQQNSTETRFDCAYTTIRMVADVALLLNGYRTSTSKPGHHQLAIQTLVHTLGVAAPTVHLLDGLRKQRNLADYDGDFVTSAALVECVRQAAAMLATLESRLRQEGWLPP
ncbi:MAG: hypothetical protein HYZ20_20545 [Burkholderiales bacterium]|nr:hypothetical protein [Burkholderiales bacterium]